MNLTVKEILSDVQKQVVITKKAMANATFQEYVHSKYGYATIEAMFTIPVFLFVMLAFVGICNIYAAKAVTYSAASRTAEYLAESAYMEEEDNPQFLSPLVANAKFAAYIDDSKLIEKYIKKGVDGVSFVGSTNLDDDGNTVVSLMYKVRMDVPMVNVFDNYIIEDIKQKAYRGFDEERLSGEAFDSIYVYVAKNGTVYHTKRTCRYLFTDVSDTAVDVAKAKGYKPCDYCGYMAGQRVLISKAGEKYHSTTSCSRLYRTVLRKKLSEVEGMNKCSVCK